MDLSLFLHIYFALFGLIVGSYLNVVIYRLPRGISTVLPRSRCPSCDTGIRAVDNLPVLSFLLLRGQCRNCGSAISWRYPAVEATAGVLFVLSFHRFGLSADGLAAILFCCLMIVLAMIDLEHYILPDRVTLPGALIGLALQPWITWTRLSSAFLGMVLGAGVLLALSGFWYLVRREMGMGMGDVKMMATVGAFLGTQGVLITLFVASLSGAAAGLALIARGKLEMKSKLPFGFFLAVGGVTALFAGQAMIDSYARLL